MQGESERHMAVRPILRFPNPALKANAAPVEHFDADLQQLTTDLIDTMRDAQSLGVTGPHIGVLQRVAVIQLDPEGEIKTYVNPQVVWASRETKSYKEGSVSMPDVLEEIERPAQVKISYQDLDGKEHVEDCDELLAVCIQHEIDQLNGVFWIDSLSRLRRDRVIKRYEKVRRLASASSPEPLDRPPV